jgi:RNA polymerase sigma-70 factor (ECF subfamily)
VQRQRILDSSTMPPELAAATHAWRAYARRTGRSAEPGKLSLVPRFDDAVEDHMSDVYAFFAYRLASRADAEDLTQTTFERAYKAWRRYDPRRASVRTWLLAIARNLLIDHYRSSAGRRADQLDDDPELAAPDAPLDLGTNPSLARALDMLGEREREIIALRFGGDLTGPEIATLTGLTLANVQQIMSRSLRRLRVELEPAEPSDQH